MRKLATLITGLGDWLLGLSDRTRLQLVVVALLVLGGGGVYKLVVSIQNLSKPLPAATPEQLIKPMQKLFSQTHTNYSLYQIMQSQRRKEIDSLSKSISKSLPSKP